MDSLANYGSDGDNSNNSDDAKMPRAKGASGVERRATDVNYDPVQMDMSEESNNNNSSGDSGSERASSPSHHERRSSYAGRDSSRHRYSPADQRRSDRDSRSSNSREEHRRAERNDHRRDGRSRDGSRSRNSSYDEKRGRRTADNSSSSRETREDKRSRDEEKRTSTRDDERRREKKSSSGGGGGGCRDEHRTDSRDKEHHHHHHHHHREERRDRTERGHRRDRERRQSTRDDRTKERSRDERASRDSKERVRSRSRSKERAPPQPPTQAPPFRALSYREGKGRNKLAQLEKLGIELKAPVVEPVIPPIIGEPNYYNPLATATQGKYAEQIQKRKLLWANKSKQDEGKILGTAASNANTWMGTTFTHDQDGKVTAKFKRLMGIKDDVPSGASQPGAKPDIVKKQEEMFNNMEQQYEVARATTHTQRGVGLGYATGSYQFPR